MSAIQNKNAVWPSISNSSVHSKYEKCRNITEEIYKRIDITFQIKSLENALQSDISDNSERLEIDSNELSNATDLFAYEKSDSISSSVSESTKAEKLVNLNNNFIKRSIVPIYKPPRKKFRKKIKKHRSKVQSDSEVSSDEAPLRSSVIEPTALEEDSVESAEVMGVPRSRIPVGEERELKQKSTKVKNYIDNVNNNGNEINVAIKKVTKCQKSIEKSDVTTNLDKIAVENKSTDNQNNKNEIRKEKVINEIVIAEIIDPKREDGMSEMDKKEVKEEKKDDAIEKKEVKDVKVKCDICLMNFKGERGLRRHVALTHILIPEEITRPRRSK